MWIRKRGRCHDFLYLPERTVELTAFVGDREYTIEHDPDNPNAQIVVPEHGSIEFGWSLAHSQPTSFYQLVLEPHDLPSDRLEFELPDDAGLKPAVVVPHVLPGSYDAFLEMYDTNADLNDLEWQPISRRVAVIVVPGHTATVMLPP